MQTCSAEHQGEKRNTSAHTDGKHPAFYLNDILDQMHLSSEFPPQAANVDAKTVMNFILSTLVTKFQ